MRNRRAARRRVEQRELEQRHLLESITEDEISDEEFDRLAGDLGWDADTDVDDFDNERVGYTGLPQPLFNPPLMEGNRRRLESRSSNPAFRQSVTADQRPTHAEVMAYDEYNRLTPQILVGAWPEDIEGLRAEGVRLIVQGCGNEGRLTQWWRYGIAHHNNATGDDGMVKGAAWFLGMYQIARPYLERGETVLFHCGAGINRGPSMAYFALRAFHGLTRDEATDLLARRRPLCAPRDLFFRGRSQAYGIAYRDDADRALEMLASLESRV